MTHGAADASPQKRLTRRHFLAGAVGLAGTLALGVEAWPAQAGSEDELSALVLAYWDGHRLVDSARLSRGDAALSGLPIHVALRDCVGPGQSLRGLTVVHEVSDGDAFRQVPFHAWAGSPHGTSGAAFTAPPGAARGLRLSVRHTVTADGQPEETPIFLSAEAAPGQPKLRAGTYILAARASDWDRCRFSDAGDAQGRLVQDAAAEPTPASFDYLVLTVRPA